MSKSLSSDTLVRRYIAQLSRRLPPKQRDDVARELDSLLRETLDERARDAEGPLSPEVTAQILREFGSPDEISRQYSPRPNYLIGPSLYPVFLLTLKAVVGGSFGLAALLTTIQTLFGKLADPWQVAGTGLATFFHLAYSLSVAAVIVFAILDRFGPEELRHPREEEWNPFDLPEAEPSNEISVFECYFKIYATIVAILWLNFFPEWVGIVFVPDGTGLHLIPLSAMGIALPLLGINLWWLIDIGLHLLLLRHGHWTRATRWMEFVLGLGAAALFWLIFRSVGDAVHSEAFAAAVPLPDLAKVLSEGLPPACIVVMVILLANAALRLFRLFRPAPLSPVD